ncbi:MAG: isocitrate/isopropylmalate dehydrogenase family protein [Candidatus Odinarchaeia archaeon]
MLNHLGDFKSKLLVDELLHVTLIPGDGIGPEVTDAMVRCVEATGVKIRWDIVIAGERALKEYGTPLPQNVIDSFKKTKVLMKAPITTQFGKGFRSVTVVIRKMFDLYANVRPAKNIEGIESKYNNVDIVVIRENTEGAYSGIEFKKNSDELKELIKLVEKTHKIKLDTDTGVTLKTISTKASRRIIRFAYNYAVKNNRKKVTVVHKSNVLKFSDGIFLEEARKISKEYPDIEYDEKVVDNMCMQLVQKPELYDVLVLPNLYGDIISDLTAGLVGGLGITPAANIGSEYAMFEAVHGSAPKYAGLNKVNPTAFIRSAIMMLRHVGEFSKADILERAVFNVIKEGKKVTYDLCRGKNIKPVGTSDIADAIIKEIEKIS